MNCTCGHNESEHTYSGCWHEVEPMVFCGCQIKVDEVHHIVELTQRATTAERERDEARAELERVKAERNDMRAVLDYWLTYARFIPRDYSPDSEHSKAVKALMLGVLPAGLVPDDTP